MPVAGSVHAHLLDLLFERGLCLFVREATLGL